MSHIYINAHASFAVFWKNWESKHTLKLIHLKFNFFLNEDIISKKDMYVYVCMYVWFYLNFAQSVVAGLNFQNIYFKKRLLMDAIRCRSTCFSEHFKVDAFFIKQPCYCFFGILLFKESPKKHASPFSLP